MNFIESLFSKKTSVPEHEKSAELFEDAGVEPI